MFREEKVTGLLDGDRPGVTKGTGKCLGREGRVWIRLGNELRGIGVSVQC